MSSGEIEKNLAELKKNIDAMMLLFYRSLDPSNIIPNLVNTQDFHDKVEKAIKSSADASTTGMIAFITSRTQICDNIINQIDKVSNDIRTNSKKITDPENQRKYIDLFKGVLITYTDLTKTFTTLKANIDGIAKNDLQTMINTYNNEIVAYNEAVKLYNETTQKMNDINNIAAFTCSFDNNKSVSSSSQQQAVIDPNLEIQNENDAIVDKNSIQTGGSRNYFTKYLKYKEKYQQLRRRTNKV
jgi:hypothetical protein